jgi:hypothetical protein
LTFAFPYVILLGKVKEKNMTIKVYKLKGRKHTFLKEYKTMKGALDYIESIKNYEFTLLGIKNNKQVVIYQGQQERKNFFEKMLDLLHIQ